ncbi:NADH-quinone oxidoreductase subunit L [candidate division CSSED10-310 bacterium]|uniref:NADH-quinone oxidoreductase subunit L n=1 Tax=candidate division CSSED10-310 bacterium TaxID=2855610 RepID=A0ABV6YY52_UNCC1
MKTIIALIPVIPFFGFLINGLGSRWITRGLSGLIACLTIALSFIFSCIAFLSLIKLPAHDRLIETTVYTWIQAGSFSVDIGFQLDSLSAIMILVVTGVGLLIHIYSIGYMSHEPAYARYFSYLNLFTFAMLILVLGNNFLLMFVGWEGVGLCSYLLIGFWYEKKSASDAGKKAFIVNRIGDFGFILGMVAIFYVFGTLDFTDVFGAVDKHLEVLKQEPFLSISLITLITLALFLGATGKSAQIPLFVWLPDAMEGPTPVSALIHAATMVTAGVYMVARCHILYLLSGTSLQIVAVVGAVTALFAATIGIMQNDIKRVLAYSTVSQLGYMFLGCGVGAFAAGIFHLMTHAFFKALLFLGAGSVIHALSGEQDIRKMGGIRKKIPWTFGVFLVATLAISGVPFFSGFFSKDEILWYSYAGLWGSGMSLFLWFIGVLTAGLTAFYMFRLVFVTFTGQTRADEETFHHIHESPKVMIIPLVVLAILAFVGGYVGMPEIFGVHNYFHHFLEPVFEKGADLIQAPVDKHPSHSMEWLLMGISVLVAGLGILLATVLYYWKPAIPARLAKSLPGVYHLILDKYRIDELYDFLIVNPIKNFSDRFLWRGFDDKVIDGTVNGIGRTMTEGGSIIRLIENGIVHRYASAIVIGFIGIMIYMLTVLY